MTPITENDLQHTLIETCRAARRRVFHTSDSRKQVRGPEGYELVGDRLAGGYPDLTIGGGREADTIWAELKGRKGHLSEEQVEWLDDLPPHRAYVWQPGDLDEAIEIITRGHPGTGWETLLPCRSCWTCHREEILQRVGTRKQRSKGRETSPGSEKGEKRSRRS